VSRGHATFRAGADFPLGRGAPRRERAGDTSVWIRFLANRGPYAGELDALLGRDEVRGHEFVYGELLIGDPSGRKALLSRYELIDSAQMVPHQEVAAFVRARKLHGRESAGSMHTCSHPRS
jgi:hypothetical protein